MKLGFGGGIWATLDVSSDVADLLVGTLHLRLDRTSLVVADTASATAGVVDVVIKALLALWGIRRFSDSRWLTVGPCARGMVAAKLTGICVYLDWVKRMPSVSGF